MADAKPEKEYCIGIDLGTTYTCVAVLKKKGEVEVIANDFGNRTTPSYVAFSDKQILIGEAAKQQAAINPRNTIYDVKRLIGRKFGDIEVRKDLKHWSFQVIEDNGNPNIILDIPNERKSYIAEEISQIVLSYMKNLASKYLGQEVKKAVITVPAYFNDAQRDATKNAGRMAGLDVMRIINEPTAAGIAYGFRNNDIKKEKKTHLLVFDLGGGTFDVSILAIQKGVYEVVATSGDSHLGGQDFDNNVVEYFIAELLKKNIDISKNDRAKIRLRTECEKGKRNLSQNTETTIVVDNLQVNHDFHSRLSRTKFDQLNEKLYKKLGIPIKSALADANLEPQDINDVVLIGGSSKIFKVNQMIAEMFPNKIRQDINNDEAVAYGAAVIAAYLNGEKHEILKDFVLRDVTSLSLGLEIIGGQMAFFIRRNKPLPQTETKWFTTNRDSQSSVCFVVYEGERPMARDNNRLGEFVISGIETGKRDAVQIKVTLTINHNGILDVSAVESLTGITKELQIQNVGRLSEVEVMKMVQDAIKFREDDQREKERIDSRLSLEDYCNNIIDCIESATIEESNNLIQKCQETLTWISDNQDVEKEEYENKLKNLKNECGPEMEKYFTN